MAIAGADGCPDGWVVCRRDTDSVLDLRVVKNLAEIFDLPGGLSILAIDMPIGLLDQPQRGGRDCEREARKRLGRKGSSVFASPCRPALDGKTHEDANRKSKELGLGISIQAFGLFPKLIEVDRFLRERPEFRPFIYEAHPELSFAKMNGGEPVLSKKRKPEGRADRLKLLAAFGLSPLSTKLKGAKADDVLDAIACYRTALLIAEGKATRLGPADACDRHGLPMNIWF